MAVKSDITYKGFQAVQAYVSYKGHKVEKVSEIVNEEVIKTYYVTVYLEIYKDDTKAIYLQNDQIKYNTNKDNDLSFTKLWQEVKKKYSGTDVI